MEDSDHFNTSRDDPSFVIWRPVVRVEKEGKVVDHPLNFHKCTPSDISKFDPNEISYAKAIPEAFARNSFYCLD